MSIKRQIHFALFVGKNAVAKDAFEQALRACMGIVLLDADQHQQAAPDLPDDAALHFTFASLTRCINPIMLFSFLVLLRYRILPSVILVGHMKKTIIFTDLDGTLLDAANYSHAKAQPALGQIEASGTPLVLCSSKTRAEIDIYRKRLSNLIRSSLKTAAAFSFRADIFLLRLKRNNRMIIS